MARRIAEGKSQLDRNTCLKRYLAVTFTDTRTVTEDD